MDQFACWTTMWRGPAGPEVAFPRCFEPGDGVAGVLGVIGDALDDALQVFCGRLWRSIGRFAR